MKFVVTHASESRLGGVRFAPRRGFSVLKFGFWQARHGALLLCLGALAGAARADEADDLTSALVAHAQAHSQAIAPEDQGHLTSFSRYLQKRFYYPASWRDLQSAAFAAIDAAGAGTPSDVLTQSAINGMVESLGHGSRFLTTLGADDAPERGKGAASSRQVGSIMLVSLPTMNVTGGNTARTCADFVRYFESPHEGRISGIVLDLRGNEGGPLTDSSCLAGLFVKKSVRLFQVLNKDGELASYEAKPTSHIDLPTVVLIDGHTDNGGLLVAAVLQDQKRAKVIGEKKADVNGAVSSLVFPPGANRGLVLPTGEIVLPDRQPLGAAVRVDVPMPTGDDQALIDAAGVELGKRK
jgi:hypothetical protein